MTRSQLRRTSSAVSGAPSENWRPSPQREDHRAAAVAQLPALGEGRAGRPRRVDRGEALEQLGDDGGAAGVAGGRRIEGRRLAHQDPGRSLGGAPPGAATSVVVASTTARSGGHDGGAVATSAARGAGRARGIMAGV